MQGLQLGLLLDGSHQGMTISVKKELRDKPPDPILGFDGIAHALLLLQRVLKIFSHGDRIAILILKPKRKVSQDPKEAWKVLGHLICICGLFALLDLRDFDRLTTSERLLSAVSSIGPMLLYMSSEQSNNASKKIFVSWFCSSSKAPRPSVSMMIIGISFSSSVSL